MAPSTFSFNTQGGRCEACAGEGYERIEMQFLADVFLPCSICGGRRFQPEILDVRYQGRNVLEILELTVDEALQCFADVPRLPATLRPLADIGLGYLRLGQPLSTLSVHWPRT